MGLFFSVCSFLCFLPEDTVNVEKTVIKLADVQV